MKLNKSFITALIFLIVMFLILLVAINYISPTGFGVPSSTTMTLSPVVEIEHDLSTTPITSPVQDKGFFYITPNYASFYDTSGNMLWNEIFNLNNLSTANNGSYISTAQYNVNSSTVYVFDTNGLVYNVQPNKKVLKHSINSNGYLALIFEEGSGYQIQTFDNTGTRILTYTFAEKNSIPVDVAISENNKYLAIPFFNYDGLTPVSKTTFLNLDKNNESGDAIFAGFDLDNTIPFSCRFINDDLFLFTDKEVARYSVKDTKVSNIISLSVNNYVTDIDVINNHYLAVAFSSKINNTSSIEPNTIAVFNLNGELLYQTEPIAGLNTFTVSNDGFLVEHSNNLTYYNLKCKPIYSYTVEQTINSAYIINKKLDTIITTSKAGIYEVIR